MIIGTLLSFYMTHPASELTQSLDHGFGDGTIRNSAVPLCPHQCAGQSWSLAGNVFARSFAEGAL
jgi:hypothetical protein